MGGSGFGAMGRGYGPLAAVSPAVLGPAGALENALLNPGFETVLIGSHTSAIQQLNVLSSTKNTEFPAWTAFTGTGAPDITVAPAAELNNSEDKSLEVTVTALGTSSVGIHQLWSGNNPITNIAQRARNLYACFFADVKNSANAVSCRLNLIDDAGTANGVALTGQTTVERIGVIRKIDGATATLKMQLEITAINAGGDTVTIDNAVLVISPVPVAPIPYIPRNPISIWEDNNDISGDFDYSTPADTLDHVTNDTTADTDPNVNSSRPPWANYVVIAMQGDAGPATFQTGAMRPNSILTDSLRITERQSAQGTVQIGEDGQLSFSVSNTSINFSADFIRWIGVNL